MAVEPDGERIFDPFLGEERDAFPGEVAPQGEETSFQKALREAGQPYLALYNNVADQLSPDELRALLKAREIAINKKARELEEAFKTNPAAIIQQVILANSEGSTFQVPIDNFDQAVEGFINGVERLKRIDIGQQKKPRTTLEYFGKNIIELTSFYAGRNPGPETTKNLFAILRDLGGLPVTGISNFPDLVSSIPSYPAVAPPEGVKLYSRSANTINEVFGLTAKRPGLEGISFRLGLNDGYMSERNTPNFLRIICSPEVCVRIVDTAVGFKPVRPADQRRLR